jgi:branched-subunit amino acid permease
MFNKSAWVSTSRMNATAAHLFAYLIIEAAPAGGVLAKIKSIKGTPFSDAQRATPQGLIITELAKTLDREDREASAKFAREFAVLARVVDLVFGEAGADLDGAIAKAIKFKPAEF